MIIAWSSHLRFEHVVIKEGIPEEPKIILARSFSRPSQKQLKHRTLKLASLRSINISSSFPQRSRLPRAVYFVVLRTTFPAVSWLLKPKKKS